MKEFASSYRRDEERRVLFPHPDTTVRKQLFPNVEVSEHHAKANIFMVRALVEYLTEPGDTILDPFGGVGTILVACTMGRKVIMIEIEEKYQDAIERNVKGLRSVVPNIDELATLIPGNNIKVLPLPGLFQHIITSPPYATALTVKSLSKFATESGYANLIDYAAHPENFSNLSDFLFSQVMEKFYKKCYESLPVGGTITIIIKDRVEAGKRVFLGKRAQRDCIRVGFEPVSWYQWYSPGGSFMGIRKHRGEMVIEDEDLITLRKGE